MNFTKPPLPFFGNKSRCKDIILRELKKLPNGLTFVDLFGGSFYISHLCHTVFPDSKIICNDFDNYMITFSPLYSCGKVTNSNFDPLSFYLRVSFCEKTYNTQFR